MQRLEMKMPSARVLSKMRNGHKVRVSKGTGLDIMLTPNTYSQISKSFDKGKGASLELSGEEIMANKEIEGGALFKDLKRGFKKLGKELNKAASPIIDKVQPFAEKAIETSAPVIRKVAAKIAEEAKDKGVPIAKTALKEGIKQGVKYGPKALAALAVASGNPELAPVAMELGKPLSKKAGEMLTKQVDRIPEKKKKAKAPAPAPAPVRRVPMPPRRPPMAPRIPPVLEMEMETPEISFEGQGLYAGKGLYAAGKSGRGLYGGAISYGSGYKNPKSIIAGELSKENPALLSQPQFTNDIMRRQLGRPVRVF